MFGVYRFLLAVMVVKSHTSCGLCVDFNVGVFAVTGFFVLTGYVMTSLIDASYTHSPHRFYADRVLRIFPQYLLFCVLTAVLVLLANTGLAVGQNMPHLSIAGVIANILLLPINFGVIPDLELSGWISRATLVPPTWSLALEFSFYLILPAILSASLVTLIAFLGSLGIFAAAAVGAFNPDSFGYRLLPGTLFIFLTGTLIYRIRRSGDGVLLAYLVLFVFGLFVIWAMANFLPARRTVEVALGIAVNGVLIVLLSGISRTRLEGGLRLARLDRFLGNTAYGVFLSHFFCMWLLGILAPRFQYEFLVITVMSACCGYLAYYFIERPVSELRLRLRGQDGCGNTHG